MPIKRLLWVWLLKTLMPCSLGMSKASHGILTDKHGSMKQALHLYKNLLVSQKLCQIRFLPRLTLKDVDRIGSSLLYNQTYLTYPGLPLIPRQTNAQSTNNNVGGLQRNNHSPRYFI